MNWRVVQLKSLHVKNTQAVKLIITRLVNLDREDKIKFVLVKNLYKMSLRNEVRLPHELCYVYERCVSCKNEAVWGVLHPFPFLLVIFNYNLKEVVISGTPKKMNCDNRCNKIVTRSYSSDYMSLVANN